MSRGLAALALTVLVAACGPTCGGSTSAGKSSVHLVFTGPAAGTLTKADVACHAYNSETQFNATITGQVDGKDLVFNIQVHSGYRGTGTYQVGTLLDGSGELRLQMGDWVGSTTTGAGTLMIINDGKSGVVDANLGQGEHVTGSFTCPDVRAA
jgi:hypothetical protein